jgi:hypothetical protein
MLEGEGKAKGRAGFGCRMRVWRKCGCRIGRDGMGWKNGRIGCSLRKKTTPKESNWEELPDSCPFHQARLEQRPVCPSVLSPPYLRYGVQYALQRPTASGKEAYGVPKVYLHTHTHTHTHPLTLFCGGRMKRHKQSS